VLNGDMGGGTIDGFMVKFLKKKFPEYEGE